MTLYDVMMSDRCMQYHGLITGSQAYTVMLVEGWHKSDNYLSLLNLRSMCRPSRTEEPGDEKKPFYVKTVKQKFIALASACIRPLIS